jgi:YVTN family beta-propeller protein
VADISGMKGLHGTAIVPAVNRGFVSGNEGDKAIVYVFDLKTNALTGKIETGEEDADGILYDAATKRVYVNNGEPMSTTVIDPATLKVVGSIKDGGEPEAAATDGNGRLFINLVDKASVAVVDARAMKVTATWSAAPCERGYGAAFDAQHHRLFLALPGRETCRGGNERRYRQGGGNDADWRRVRRRRIRSLDRRSLLRLPRQRRCDQRCRQRVSRGQPGSLYEGG